MSRIVAENVSVEFPIYDTTGRSLRHALGLGRLAGAIRSGGSVGGAFGETRGHLVVRALDGISFTVDDGERIGLIGHNGCGKTTLLRVLAGIYEPTSGRLGASGRVMPLFNLMEGSAPEATGMELIYIRGILLGLTQDEIREMTPEIVEFCELGDYINVPVRTYSTGMLVRLAFAITTAVSAEILLFDELIGAGDAHFVDRAQVRLRKFVERSSVMVVASHSQDILRKWCTRAILMQHGKILEIGPVDPVLAAYDRLVAKQ